MASIKPAALVPDHKLMSLTNAMRRLESMWSMRSSLRETRLSQISEGQAHSEPPLKYAVNPNVGREAWSLATIDLIAKDFVVGIADLQKLPKWASRRTLKYFTNQTRSNNFFTYAPCCLKGSAVAQGIKDSMMVPVETYIDDDSKFVEDTVNNNEAFLLLVSALIKDEDMARMLQNAPALRPDVRKDLNKYNRARDALAKKHQKNTEGELYKKALKAIPYPAIIFEDDKINKMFKCIASRISRPEFRPLFEELHQRCSDKFNAGGVAGGSRCAPASPTVTPRD